MRRSVKSTARLQSMEIQDLMQAALGSLLMAPPGRIWLVSPWITDSIVMDNRGAEFRTLAPSWPESQIHLSTALRTLAENGHQIMLVVRPDPQNENVLGKLKDVVDVKIEEDVHRKRLVAEKLFLWGSMNFTRAGMQKNAEDVELVVAPADVATAVSEMYTAYGEPGS